MRLKRHATDRIERLQTRVGGWIRACGILGAFLVLVPGPVLGQELFEGEANATPMEVERMYLKGLGYLTQRQNDEGGFPDRSYGSEPAVVGLSVVSMLAHGDDPNFGPYSQAIRRGLDFILKQMNEQTGYIGRSMYNHGFSTLALAESYGVVDDERLGPALEKAVNLILSAQSRNPFGAWRYSPESTDADTTVSGAQLVALFAARNAGIAVPEVAIRKGLAFFRTCQTKDGGYAYTPGSSSNAARTAIGCLTLALAKEKDSNAFAAASAYLKDAPSTTSYYHYYLYYASQAFFHTSPEAWTVWNATNIKKLSDTQNADGSWDGQFGPTFATAASLLSMALNYRYLPIYER